MTCPPDIEEIDLFIPFVGHKWFSAVKKEEDAVSEAVREIDDNGTDGEVMVVRPLQDRRRIALQGWSSTTKGFGYSCKSRDARPVVFGGSDGVPGLVHVNRGAW